MRARFIAVLLVLLVGAVVIAPAQTVTCTQTGFFRDGINMTAAMINPTGVVTGNLDATGCNIGVYYDNGVGTINAANISGSNYFGVVVNGDYAPVTVNITNSTVTRVGETPFNGAQHGVAIYYRAFGTGSTAGKISGNTVSLYQKGGIVVTGASTLTVMQNTVRGNGRVPYIAQNGIQFSYGATGQIKNNTVSEHAYTGTNCASSAGILIVGGAYFYGYPLTTGVSITQNILVNNDVGAFLFESDDPNGILPPSTPTNNKVGNNTITNDADVDDPSGNALTNLGCGIASGIPGYQAGISDFGNNDKINNNSISGLGYAAYGNELTYAVPIDTTGSTAAKVHINPNK